MAITASIKMTRDSGFTLLEIIAAIIISSLLALMIVQIATNNTTRSYLPLANLNGELALQDVMEDIAADYRLFADSHPSPLVELQSKINAGAYWTAQPFGSDIKISENYCFEFVVDTGTNWQEGSDLGTCSSSDTNLKVTLTYGNSGGPSLTAVFSR